MIDEKTGEVRGTYVENNPEISFVYEKDEETPEPGKPEPGKPELGKPNPSNPTPTNPSPAKPSPTNPSKPVTSNGKLPQTDEVKTTSGILGVSMVIATAVLAFVTKRNKRKDSTNS